MLIYDDEIVEYMFDDISFMQSQARRLESLKIHRLDVAEGLAKILGVLTLFVASLQFIVWLSS
ncbi:hypothetical protein ATY79_27065 [Rhizobium sp. R693]|nr:hypothetical protein ATY79_27065 [Rhizobium sp. R693]